MGVDIRAGHETPVRNELGGFAGGITGPLLTYGAHRILHGSGILKACAFGWNKGDRAEPAFLVYLYGGVGYVNVDVLDSGV